MYLALIIFSILSYLAFQNKTSKSSIKKYIIVMTILLIVISSLRHEAVGNDTYAYMRFFDQYAEMSWSEVFDNFWTSYLYPGEDGKDPGQLVIIKALSYVVPNSRVFLCVVAALLLIPLGVLVYRNSKTLETPCFFYVFYITMFYPYLPNSAVRQSLALTILLIGFLSLQKGKMLRFMMLLFVATFVHKSIVIAALIIPFYYLKNIKASYRLSLLLFIIMLFTYKYVGVFMSMQSEIYEAYGSGEYYATAQSVPFMVILMILGLYVIGWIGIGKDKESYNKRLIYGGAAMTLVWVVMVRLDPSVIRLTAYFGPWMGLMVPDALRLSSRRDFNILFAILLLVFIARAIMTPDNYHFLWQEMALHDRY